MKVYMVTVDTGIVGYKFEEIVEAEGDEEATEKALKAVDDKLKFMKNHLKVTNQYLF